MATATANGLLATGWGGALGDDNSSVYRSQVLQRATGHQSFHFSYSISRRGAICTPDCHNVNSGRGQNHVWTTLDRNLIGESIFADSSNGARFASAVSRLKEHSLTEFAEIREDGGPLDALEQGTWVKLICGASFEDVVEVRSLALVYTLAGVNCIDCACDAAIVTAVQEAISAALRLSASFPQTSQNLKPPKLSRPLVMVSLNDDQDPHFRKAAFDSDRCPADCPRPCERICPAAAIGLTLRERDTTDGDTGPEADGEMRLEGGVIEERCYGCGRCISVCPLGLIEARSYVRPPEAVAALLREGGVDAVEIHTQGADAAAFRVLWEKLGPAFTQLKLVAVSLPESALPQMHAMYDVMAPLLRQPEGPVLIWQLDGRPMSGDIGAGATRAACRLAEKVLHDENRPPGYLQLAGGTNAHTAAGMQRAGLMSKVAGVAFGGYARKILYPLLSHPETAAKIDSLFRRLHSETNVPSRESLYFLEPSVREARALLAPFRRH